MANRIKCFHLSHTKNRQSILLKGLEPRAYTGYVISYEPRIFFATSRKSLAFDYVDFEHVDVWEFFVTPDEIRIDWVSSYENHFYITRGIPPNELRLAQYLS